MDAMVQPFSGKRSTDVVHVDFGGQSPTTHTEREEFIKDMKGWRVREIYTSSSSDGDDDEEQSRNELSETSEAVAPLGTGTMYKGVPVVFMLAPQKRKAIQR